MTTPPDRFTPELESMISVMSGDEASARYWIARLNAKERRDLRLCLPVLDRLLREGMPQNVIPDLRSHRAPDTSPQETARDDRAYWDDKYEEDQS